MRQQTWHYTTAVANVDSWFIANTSEDLNEALEKLGKNGYELVATLPTSHEHRYALIFKRPV
jgi:hypothetical protein